jgi:hypothetical protein
VRVASSEALAKKFSSVAILSGMESKTEKQNE